MAKLMKELLQKSENRICADCGAPGLIPNGRKYLREHE